MTTSFPTPRQRAVDTLTHSDIDLTTLNKPEIFILGYELAWQSAILLTEDIVNQLETEDTTETETES